MRVLVVGDAASINVRRWCEGLVDAGAEVEMLSFEPAWHERIPVTQLKFASLGAVRYLLAGVFARRLARRRAPDLVCGYYVTGYGTTAHLLGIHPLVLVTAGRDVEENPPGTLLHRLTTGNLRAADLVIAWGQHMANAAQVFGVPASKILVQPRGIPLDRYQPKAVSTSSERLGAIVTRSLEPVYRHSEILHAIAQLGAPDLRLTVVGDGSLRQELQALAERLGLGSQVRFVGRVPNDALPTLLAQHDLYVSARPHDGVSASLLEAMAAGLTPIVPNHPANQTWIEDGVNGLLVEPSLQDLSAAIRRAMSDLDLRRAAAMKNPAIVQSRGNLSSNMQRFVDAFADLLRR